MKIESTSKVTFKNYIVIRLTYDSTIVLLKKTFSSAQKLSISLNNLLSYSFDLYEQILYVYTIIK